MRTALLAACAIAPMAMPAHAQTAQVGANSPAPDCTVMVTYDPAAERPGYTVTKDGTAECVPFTPTANLPPADYEGDFYGEMFTHARILQEWAACTTEECRAGGLGFANAFGNPSEFRLTYSVDAVGQFDPHAADIDLADIRGPAYFGAAPYEEAISAAADQTYIVDFVVPAEPMELAKLEDPQPVHLRGWYIQGDGVETANGENEHVLVVLVSGRSVETTALQHPDDVPFAEDAATGLYAPVTYPNETTEKWAGRQWRDYINAFHEAGFDVFTVDKRGHGISGGYGSSNTYQQALDVFRGLDALETGEGLRLLSPEGETLEGADAAGVLLRGVAAKDVPFLIGGSSQGSMVTSYVMHSNFVEDCSFDQAELTCGPAKGYNNLGAIVLAEFAHALGWGGSVKGEAALRAEHSVTFVPSSEILVGAKSWPAIFIGRGLWDFAGGLEGSLDLYNRVTGPKDIAVVRAGHSEVEWGDENIAFVQERMINFALAVARGDKTVQGANMPSDIRALVETAPTTWQLPMRPEERP